MKFQVQKVKLNAGQGNVKMLAKLYFFFARKMASILTLKMLGSAGIIRFLKKRPQTWPAF